MFNVVTEYLYRFYVIYFTFITVNISIMREAKIIRIKQIQQTGLFLLLTFPRH